MMSKSGERVVAGLMGGGERAVIVGWLVKVDADEAPAPGVVMVDIRDGVLLALNTPGQKTAQHGRPKPFL